jgi:hypothetical protein
MAEIRPFEKSAASKRRVERMATKAIIDINVVSLDAAKRELEQKWAEDRAAKFWREKIRSDVRRMFAALPSERAKSEALWAFSELEVQGFSVRICDCKLAGEFKL